MADIDKMLDQHLKETERFTPVPDRMMYGKAYQNVPWDIWKEGSLSPFDPNSKMPQTDYITTDEGQLLWRLRQLLSN